MIVLSRTLGDRHSAFTSDLFGPAKLSYDGTGCTLQLQAHNNRI